MDSFEQMIIAFIIGVSVAAIYTYYTKTVLGDLVRRLMERDAFDEDSAVTLEDAGCRKGFFVKYSLRPGTDFSETVIHTNGKYYIPEDKIEKAEAKYKDEGVTVLIVLGSVLALAVVALIASYIFPDLMAMIKGI